MNGNPYYTGSLVPDVSDTVLKVGEMGMRREAMTSADDYRKKQLGLDQQRVNIEQQKIPASKQPWDMSNATRLKNKFRLQGLDPDKMPEVFEPLDQMAKDPTMMRGDIATSIEQGWESQFKPTLINNLATQSASLAKKAAGMKEDDPNRNKVLAEMKKLEDMQSAFAQVRPEHIVSGFFPDIHEERQNTKAALATVRATNRPTIGNIQAGVITRWLDGERLTKEEEAIKGKYFRGDKDTYGDTKVRWQAKIDAFESAIGRRASEDEKRRLFISDPYGILAPGETEAMPAQPPTLGTVSGIKRPSTAQPKYSATATDAKGNKVGWDGKQWVPIK